MPSTKSDSWPDHDDPTLVTSPLEITNILETLRNQNTLISARIDGGAHTIITTLLDIDVKQGCVVMDAAREPRINNRAARADEVLFQAALNRIQVRFSTGPAALCQYEGKPALRFGVPYAMRRIQRRDFYRVATPANGPAQCTVRLAPSQQDDTTVTLNLKDISAGGIALIDNGKQLDVTMDTVYNDCVISLPEVGTVTATLRVVQAVDNTLPNEKAVRYVGCAFVNPAGVTTNTVQRYIGLLERKLGAKRFGTE
jgi:c-di-GMP-binding flagellar brake protein YcgR